MFPLGIASGALRHEIELVLDRAGLRDCFRFIVAVRRHAARASRRRIRICGRRSCTRGEPAACVAIEDSRWGIESATAAGMACVGITQSYARGSSPAPTAIIDSLDELTPALVRSLDRS